MSTNKPEPLEPPYRGGDAVVGKALRTFFISLLNDKNLSKYHQDRNAYIDGRVKDETAKKLLKSRAFIDIERHILAITGSSRAKPLFVVCPPY
jgi:hypothetical protein